MNKKLSPEKLAKYFSGEPDLTDQEREDISESLKSNPNLRRQYGVGGPPVDSAAAKHRLLNRIEASEQLKSAEARKSRPKNNLPYQNLSSRRSVQYWPVRIAAVLAVVFVFLSLTTYIVHNTATVANESPELTETVTTTKGQRVRITLPDGTEVDIGNDSWLQYSKGMVGAYREVTLEGEAYFNVIKDNDRPFIVRAGGTITEVLGTSFNIRSYQDDRETTIVVSEGIVSFGKEKEGQSNGVILKNKQLGKIDSSENENVTVLSNVNLDHYLGWRDGRLIFVDDEFGDIITSLERWYNVEINFSEEGLEHRRFTGSFHNESLRNVLQIISVSMQLDYEIDGQQIIFSLE